MCDMPSLHRVQNDIWAFGLILSLMADVSPNDTERELLKHIASLATVKADSRISLSDAISYVYIPENTLYTHSNGFYGVD